MTKLSENPRGLAHREPIPGYTMIKRIGAGGYGEVWQVDAPGGLKKAIKIVFGAVNDVRAVRELKALERIRQVHHPMLLSLERIEAIDDHLIVVTELADMSMRDCYDQYVTNGRMGIPREELLAYLRDAADGLDFLYERHSLQHLDVKPENLLLVGGRIKVADFGMIKDLHEKSVSIVAGVTPLYAPPELFDGQPNRHSDQYSLAVLYQEMLTGQAPFSGRTPAQIAIQQLQGSPVLSPLPRLDQPVVARALSKNPEQRFPNCRTFVDQLMEASKSGRAGGNTATPSSARRVAHGLPRNHVDGTVILDATALPMGPLPMPIANDVVVAESPPVVQRNPVLRPTLIVGVGGTANKVIAEIRQRLKDQFGDVNKVPCIRFVAIDTDTEDLNRDSNRNHVDWHIGEAVAIPLRSASDYREYREPLLEWLSRRWLYNIPRSLQTEGIRPLGRLAFVDHFQEIRKKLAHAIHGIMAEDSIQESVQTTSWPVDAAHPEVLLLGNIAGGTAGGALLDLVFTIRSELDKLQLNDRMQLFLMHCTNRRSSHRDLAIANASVFLKEFSDMAGTHGRYPGEPTCGIPAYENSRSQFADVVFHHLGDELDDESYSGRIRLLADCLARRTFSPAAETMRQFQVACGEQDAGTDYATLDSIGISSVASLLGTIPTHFASQVVLSLLDGWISPRLQSQRGRRWQNSGNPDCAIPLESAQDDRTLENTAIELLQSRHFEWTEILQQARDSLVAKLKVELHVDDGRSLAQLDRQLEQLANAYGSQRAHELIQDLWQVMDAEGNCIYAASAVANSFRRKLSELAEQLHSNWENVNHECVGLMYGSPAENRGTQQVDGTSSRLRVWAELRAALFLVRKVNTEITAVSDQLLELGRLIRQIRDQRSNTTPLEELGNPDDPFLDWSKNQVSQWVQELDKQAGRQLATTGRPISSLLGQSHDTLRRALDLLHNLAYRIIESSVVRRSLDESSRPRNIENAFEPFNQLLETALPRTTLCGGIQRWGAILPPTDEAMRATIQEKISEVTAHSGFEIHDNSSNLLVFCQMSHVPLDNMISALVGTRRELLPLAERLHTRNDLQWSPVL